MRVQKRRVNTKRHTIGWKIGGKWVSRRDAWDLARQGRVEGVVACRGESGVYIQSHPNASTRLYDLDEVVDA
jgi:hypothetical protein